MSKRLRRVTIHRIIAPNEFAVSRKKCALDSKDDLSHEMMSDWLKRRHEDLAAWSPSLYEEVMVFETEVEFCCCRGCIIGCVDDGLYSVYLYDQLILREIRRKFMRSLKDEFKKLAPTSFILRIPGIRPAQLTSTSIYGKAINKPCRQQCVEGDKWTSSSLEAAEKWVDDSLKQEREVRYSVIKELGRVVTVGDLLLVESQTIISQSYTEYLCNKKLAILNQEWYNQDLNIVQEDTPQENSLLSTVSSESGANEMNDISENVVDDTEWTNLMDGSEGQACGYNHSDARLNLKSTMYGMALAGKSFSTHRKSRKPEGTTAYLATYGTSQEKTENLKLNRLPRVPGPAPSPSFSDEESIRKKNLFERVYDPDNCFDNAYKAVQPDKTELASRRPSTNTIGFNEARIYDQAFRSNGSSSANPTCSNKLEINTADSFNSTTLKTNCNVSSKSYRRTETSTSGANLNSRPVIVETKTLAQKAFFEKAQMALPTCQSKKQPIGTKFGKTSPDIPNPFFLRRNDVLPNGAVGTENKCYNLKSDRAQISSSVGLQVSNKVNTVDTYTTKYTSVERDRTGSVVSSLPKASNSHAVDGISSEMALVSSTNCERMHAKPRDSIAHSQSPSDDVPDGSVLKAVISTPRTEKPFVCVLPSWNEVKIKVANKSGDLTSVPSPKSYSARGRFKNSAVRQVRREPSTINEANGSLIVVSTEDHSKRHECSQSKFPTTKLKEHQPVSSCVENITKSHVRANTVVDRLGVCNNTFQSTSSNGLIKLDEENIFESTSILESNRSEIEDDSKGKFTFPSTPADHLITTEKPISISDRKSSAVQEGLSGGSTVVHVENSSKSAGTTFRPVASCSFDADNLLRMIAGRSFVYGKTPAQPYLSISEFPYLKVVKNGLYNNLLKKFNSLQNNVIPNILLGRNVFIIDNKSTGKSLAYMIPIVAKIMQDGKTMCKNARSGPFAVFLTACITKGTTLETNLNSLLDSANVKDVVGYFAIQNDHATKQDLKGGCEIMITTPECLLEMIENCLPYFSFERLMYLVIDDGDICVNENSKLEYVVKLLKKVKHGLTSMGPRECPFQTVFVGNTWSPEMESATNIVSNPVLVLGPLQATVFAGVKTVVEYIQTEEDKLVKFLELFGRMLENSKVNNRIIIVCKNNETVRLVKEEIHCKYKWTISEYVHSDDMNSTSDPEHIDGLRQRWLDPANVSLEVIACTDSVIKELGITNSSQLIHFDVAVTAALFAKRFCTMWTWFRSEDDRKTMLEPKVLSSRLFLTSEDSNLVEIVKRLKELGCMIPANLEKDYEKVTSENDKRLCCGFLRVGFCNRSDTTCENRHDFLPKDLTDGSWIPTTGQVEVRIAETYSASCYLAQLVRHYEPEGGKTKLMYDFNKEFQRRSQFLKKYYEEEKNKVKITSFERDRYVAVWDPSTETYFRAQIDSVLTNNLPKVIRLFCLDGGHYISKSLENPQLYELPIGYDSAMSSFAVELILANLKPRLRELDYMPSHKSKAAKLVNHDSTLVGRICLAFGQRIWVDQLVEFETDASGKMYTKRSMRKEFVNLKYADYNLEHMEVLYKSCEKAGLSIAKYENLRSSSLGIEFARNFYCLDDPIQWAHLSLFRKGDIGSVPILWVTFVKAVDTIFCNHEKFADQLIDLNKCMNEEIEALRKMSKIPEPKNLRKYFEEGMIVVVKDPGSQGEYIPWVRALITRVHQNTDNENVLYDVFLVDVGEEIFDLELFKILPIPKVFVNKLPFQAIALKLGHVLPIGNSKEWTPQAMEQIYESVFPPPDEYSAKIQAVAVSKLETFDYPYCRYYTSYIILDQLELGEKLVLENVAAYAEGGEEGVKNLKAGLLELLNSVVDISLKKKDKQETGSESDELEGHQANEDVDESGEDSDDWDLYYPNQDALKPFLPEELAAKITTMDSINQVPAILPSPSSVSTVAIKQSRSETNPEEHNVTACNFSTDEVKGAELRMPIPICSAVLKTPTTTWSQNTNEINLRIDITDVKTYKLEVKTDKKTFTFETVRPPGYGFEIKLYKKVESSPIDVLLLGACLKIKLVKRSNVMWWPRLTENKSKPRWIQQDLGCIPSDDDSEISGEDGDESFISPVASKARCRKKRSYTQVNFDTDDTTSSEAEGNSELEILMQ